jgi:hypothetical protein
MPARSETISILPENLHLAMSDTAKTSIKQRTITFNLKENQQEVEFMCLLSKGVLYTINLNVPDIVSSKLQVSLLDGERKEVFNKKTNLKTDPKPSYQFNCVDGGMYSLKVVVQ